LAARAIDYVNAGTVEFIVAPDGGFWFMEINTRLQVEHPVTEMVTGLDLVEWQLRVAAGEPLPLAQEQITQDGHAIEVRLYAEDPEAGFLPGSGGLERLRLPAPSDHVRIDSGVVEGDTVTIFYDPMIAKLIVQLSAHALHRPAALARLREALAACIVEGPKSNVAFLERLVRHPAVVEATIDTGYLDRNPDEFMPAAGPASPTLLVAAATAALLRQERAAHDAAQRSLEPGSPWAIADGWRLGHAGERLLVLRAGDERHEIHASGSSGRYQLRGLGEGSIQIEGAHIEGGRLSLRIDGRARSLLADADDQRVLVHDGDRRLHVELDSPFRFAGDAGEAGDDRVRAPMPGRVVLVRAAAGDSVEE